MAHRFGIQTIPYAEGVVLQDGVIDLASVNLLAA